MARRSAAAPCQTGPGRAHLGCGTSYVLIMLVAALGSHLRGHSRAVSLFQDRHSLYRSWLISKGATEFIKSPAGCIVIGRLAGEGLPSSDCDVDRAGIDLHAAAHAFCLLRGDQCRALSEKRVEYNLARGGAVHYRVSDQSHRFDRVARIS